MRLDSLHENKNPKHILSRYCKHLRQLIENAQPKLLPIRLSEGAYAPPCPKCGGAAYGCVRSKQGYLRCDNNHIWGSHSDIVYREEHTKQSQLISENRKVLSERKITIEIDDSDETPRITAAPVSQSIQSLPSSISLPLSATAKEEFIKKAQAIGDFNDPAWVSQLINGMKQVGVQGLDRISNESHPVGRGEIKQLIKLLVELVGSK